MPATDRSLDPVSRQVGKLTISVDPRMELLSTVQAISDYGPIRREGRYYEAIGLYFASYAGLPAVSQTSELFRRGFSHDAPVAFMLHLGQPDACELALPYSDYVAGRAGGVQRLDSCRQALGEFAAESSFDRFWKRNESFYRQIVDLCASEAEGVDWIGELEKYYNISQNSYNIIISPLFHGGYGPCIPAGNGKSDLYACLSPGGKMKEGVPYLDRGSLVYYLWHEFGHSFVNPETGKYPQRLAATAGLFEPIKTVMSSQAYTDWESCVNEHIIRAVHIRLIETCLGEQEAAQKLQEEHRRRFVYIDPLIEKLKAYETLREAKGIAFADFMPDLLGVFDSIAETGYAPYLAERPFSGPVNMAFQADNTVIVYPTGGPDSESAAGVEAYAENMHRQLFKQARCIPDTLALESDLSGCALVVYGTPESNLLLKKYRSLLPFRIEGNAIVADRKYVEPGIKLILCLPNPQDKTRGMVVYTAASDRDIPGINDVFHGPEDYVLFVDREHVLHKGFFDKSGNWAF